MPEKDISIGDVFGSLIVDRFETVGKNKTLVAKCVCGKEKVFWKKSAIVRQHSCGCRSDLTGLTGKQRRSWNLRLQGYKNGAKKRNLVWELSFQDFVDIASQNCHFCGSTPTVWDCISNAPSIQRDSPKSLWKDYLISVSGVDRFDSSKGYTLENCVPCCTNCNRAKSDMSFENFKTHVEKMYKWLLQNPKNEK